MFGILRRDIVAELLDGRLTVEGFYRILYFMAVAVTVAIFALSLLADVAGFNGLNIVLIPVWVIVVGYFGFHPTYILAALTTGAVASLGRDADRQRVIDGIKAALGKWKLFFLHGAMFGGVFFLTRFLVPIKAYPFMGMVMLGALITLGLWAWLYESGTAYKRYVLILVLVSLAIGVFGAFAGKPATAGHPAAPAISLAKDGVADIMEDFRYTKTFEAEVWNRQGTRLCGVRPGTRKFSIPRTVEVKDPNGDNLDITSTLRVNGAFPGEKFTVESNGCVAVTFSVNEGSKGIVFPRQIIAIKFE